MSTGLDVFDSSLEKTNIIFKRIEDELEWSNRRRQTYHAVRTFLHALRDRLTIDQAVQFSAQLPLILKGVFFDGWNPKIVPIKMHREEFVQYVAGEFQLDVKEGTDRLIRIVSDAIFDHISPDERFKVLNNLPKDLFDLLA